MMHDGLDVYQDQLILFSVTVSISYLVVSRCVASLPNFPGLDDDTSSKQAVKLAK